LNSSSWCRRCRRALPASIMSISPTIMDTIVTVTVFAVQPDFPGRLRLDRLKFTPSVVPEPETWLMLAAGSVLVGAFRRRSLSPAG
jgi:hypothetical protein